MLSDPSIKQAFDKAAEGEWCWFCRKTRREVKWLIQAEAPPRPCICNECVAQAQTVILSGELKNALKPKR